MAASLVLGLLVGQLAVRPPGAFRAEGGELVAQGQVAQALDDRLAADGGPTRVALSFRTADGTYCRSFESGPARLAGVACHRRDGWVAQTLTAWSPPHEAQYRTAASEAPAPVLAAVDQLIAGPALDAAAEAKARATGWKP